MPLILAIEPDRRQAHEITAIVRKRLRADLVLGDAAESALAQLGDRVPDLILTPALISSKDETILADWLRRQDAAAAQVQTLTIPVLDSPEPPSAAGRGSLFSLRAERASSPAVPNGCDPAVFAEQCKEYLDRAASERGHLEPSEPEPAPEPVPPSVNVEHESPRQAAVEPPLHQIEPPVERLEPPAEQIESPVEQVADGEEVDLTAMLDESVFKQLSEAIETVSRDSSTRIEAPAGSGTEVWKPSSLGSPAVWPALDFTAPAKPQPPRPAAKPAATKFPSRKPIQDEWGFFDPAQCGFAALLAKLDEITHETPSLTLPETSSDPHETHRV